jgi:hypothetical protein
MATNQAPVHGKEVLDILVFVTLVDIPRNIGPTLMVGTGVVIVVMKQVGITVYDKGRFIT